MKPTTTPKGSPQPTFSAIPRPLFSCGVDGCREEVSYHADQLFWYAPDKHWVCENCWADLPRMGDEYGGDLPEKEVSLEAHILASGLSAADLLQNAKNQATRGPCGVYRLINDAGERWISKPDNGGDLGDMQDTVAELNKLLDLLQRTHYNLIGRHGWGDADATLIGNAMGWDSGRHNA